jgi:Trp operon repressor
MCCAMVVDGRRVVEDEMHVLLECPLYSADRKLLFQKLRIESELVDKDLSMRKVMNPESFEGWKYLIKFIKKCDETRKLK